MRIRFRLFSVVALIAAAGCLSKPQNPSRAPAKSSVAQLPGKQADGSVLLPNAWSLRPAGKQVDLGDFPVNIAVHPGGRYAAILHAGYSRHEIAVVDIREGKVISRQRLRETFYGIQFSHDGRQLFCSGAGDEVIHVFSFDKGHLHRLRNIKLHDRKERGVPAGLAIDSKTRELFTANVWGQCITRVQLDQPLKCNDILLGTNQPEPVSAAVIPSADADTAAAEKRAEAALYESDSDAPFPYTCLIDEKRNRLYVTLWAQSAVAVIDLRSNDVIARWPTQEHPCEMALTRTGSRLFVANANRNTVTVFDAGTGKTLETIWAALYPSSPPGSTPNSLALSPDDKTLFVANANINVVAVFDVSTPGKSRSLGFIPVGWYPTSVRVTPDGHHLLVANGKGILPKANPNGPRPGVVSKRETAVQYIGRLLKGTLSVIDIPSRNKFLRQMAAYTKEAYRNSPLTPDASVSASRPGGNPIPQQLGQPSPIKYCIYIIKENRTYDQILGDVPEGNGDPSLCLFSEKITPNHHRLARQFVLLDNFYVEAEVSAQGHEWSMGAYSSDFVERMWRMSYGHNKLGKYPYPSEGNFPVAFPSGGYLWDKAKAAGVSYRSYGEFIQNGRTPDDPGTAKVRSLKGHFDPSFHGFDLNYPDAKRADRFISELKRFETEGNMPQLQILRLPNDHTHGSTEGFRTPRSYVAGNDAALGRVIDAITHSKFWPQTAIFVVEDDAQNGSDHVDAHRTVAFVISPYTKRHFVDSTLYSTSGMLRTMELILGLQPMSQFDAAATPMFNSFQSKPDLSGYAAVPAMINLDEKNASTAWGAEIKGLDFAEEDAVDDLLLNEMIWRSVRGAHSPMPAPVRAAFVFAHPKDDDD